MPYVLALMCAGAVIGLLYVWRAAKPLGPTGSAGSAAAMADALVWYDGDLSPNGRRVLWVEPASSTLLSMTGDPSATAWFAKGCPVDVEALGAQLPDEHVKEKVAWGFTDDEVERVRRGFTPEAMEDKWRIVTLAIDGAERVYLFRSWTGALMYVLELGGSGVRWVWRGAKDPLGVELARSIVDAYLLGRVGVIPAPRELGEDKLKLMLWGIKIAGRWCKAVEPGNV